MFFLLLCLSVNTMPLITHIELNGNVKLNNTYCEMKARAASLMLTFKCVV